MTPPGSARPGEPVVEGEAGPDAGVGLVELVVVMALALILGAMIVTTFTQGAQAVFASDARGAATAQAKVATENLSKQLRLAVDPDAAGTATAFETATPTEVVFYSANANRTASPAADLPPKKVRIWLDAGTVRQTVIEPVVTLGVTSWPGAGTTRVVGVDVVTGGLPLFTYLAAGDVGAGDDGVTTTSIPNSDGTVTGVTALAAIQAVEIWVSVENVGARTSDRTTAVTRVTLLNR